MYRNRANREVWRFLGKREKDEQGNHLLTINGSRYRVANWYDVTPLDSARRDPRGNIVVNRRRDFGGCGKDAMKLETNVPIEVWLREIHAVLIEE